MRFQKPTPEEVTSYARKIGFILNGEEFCDFYESKGWMVGKSPMKVWQAAVRTWKHKEPRADRWGAPKTTQTPPDADKVAAAKVRMEDRRQREWDRREAVRLAQERDDARSRKMAEAAGEKEDDFKALVVFPNALGVTREEIDKVLSKVRDENGNKWIEEMERSGADGE